MKTIILSPHVDDAIFSLGDYMQTLSDVTILSVFSGTPADDAGWKKHNTLNWEHKAACQTLGVDFVNGEFLDDVYGLQDKKAVTAWLEKTLEELKADYIIAPLGIHHPDHILLNQIALFSLYADAVYEELPYKIVFPEETAEAEKSVNGFNKKTLLVTSQKKIDAVKCYESQIKNDHILSEIFVPESVYFL